MLGNILQPVDSFVERPRLEWKLAGPMLFFATLVWFGALAFLGISSFKEAHSYRATPLRACALPTDKGTCRETTAYPKRLEVELHGYEYGAFEVTLNGPYRLSLSQIEDAIAGMTCKVNTSNGWTIFSPRADASRPVGFSRSCTNPLVPAVALRPLYDELGHFRELSNHLKVAKALRFNGGSLKSSVFEFLEVSGERAQWHIPTPAGDKLTWAGVVMVHMTFEDGTLYSVGSIHVCDGSVEPYEIIDRDCHRGYPYFDANIRNIMHAEQCPLVMSPSVEAAIEFYKHNSTKELSLARWAASQFCKGFEVQAMSHLELYENHSLDPFRPTSALPRIIANGIDQQCPYTFECMEPQFQGAFIWMAAIYPPLLIVGRVLLLLVQRLYRALQNVPMVNASSDIESAEIDGKQIEGAEAQTLSDIETRPQLRDASVPHDRPHATVKQTSAEHQRSLAHEGNSVAAALAVIGPPLPPRQNLVSQGSQAEAAKLAVAECLEGLDIEMLRRLPEIVSKINQRLTQLEVADEQQFGGQLESRGAEQCRSIQISSLEEHIAPIKNSIKEALYVELQPVLLQDMTTGPIKNTIKTSLLAEFQPIWSQELDLMVSSCKHEIAGLEAQFLSLRSKVESGLSKLMHGGVRCGIDGPVSSTYLEHLNGNLHSDIKHLRAEVADLAYLVDQGLRPPSNSFRSKDIGHCNPLDEDSALPTDYTHEICYKSELC